MDVCVRKDIDDKTSVALHYDWTDMDNVLLIILYGLTLTKIL